MHFPMSSYFKGGRVPFASDETKQSTKVADEFLEGISRISITTVQVLPHESIHGCCTVGHSRDERTAYERGLCAAYLRATQNSRVLRKTKLELMFGERINVIARLASLINVQIVLMPVFKQSVFSN